MLYSILSSLEKDWDKNGVEKHVYLVRFHKSDKNWEEDRWRRCLGILPKIFHSIIKGILQQTLC